MNSPNNLEISGDLQKHPLAELLIELLETRLDGSLRLSNHTHKAVVYVKQGRVVFAVSNQKQHRIYEMLLQSGLVTAQQLAGFPDFANDLNLIEEIKKRELFSESDVDLIVVRQIEVILKNACEWRTGSWAFSPLARIKEDLCRSIDIFPLLMNFARSSERDWIIRRFKSLRESFGLKPPLAPHIGLLPQEAFVLSRFEKSFCKIEDIKTLSGLSDAENLRVLYALWLGGFLYRKDWDAAMPPGIVSRITAAKLELKKEEHPGPASAGPSSFPLRKEPPKPAVPEKLPASGAQPADDDRHALEKYLSHTEQAETHYQILNISPDATADEVKKAYFGLAKRFHPDLFHKKTDARTHGRIQQAFTEIAHAYDVLRNEESRRSYDYKLRKILDELNKSGVRPQTPEPSLTEASDIFQRGLDLLKEERIEDALPLLNRAVSMAPETARYRAYFGKALAADNAQRFKAEAELLAAIKLEPQEAEYRLMFVEFCIQNNLLKRAEGELNRLLAISPGNAEALALLDSLGNK